MELVQITTATVPAAISIYTAIEALEVLSARYPAERLSQYMADALHRAAKTIEKRIDEREEHNAKSTDPGR